MLDELTFCQAGERLGHRREFFDLLVVVGRDFLEIYGIDQFMGALGAVHPCAQALPVMGLIARLIALHVRFRVFH